MKIIENSNAFHLYDLCNNHDDLYFRDVNAFAHPYRGSIVIIDLTNAMQSGKTCARWLFHVSAWHQNKFGMCESEYLEMAAPDCDSFGELITLLRSGAPLTEVDGLSVETGAQPSSKTFSPFAPARPVKLGERLTASTIAKAIRAGQIVSGRTDGRYTDDYASDAAYDFYRGEIDLIDFASDIYEHPSGWRFWWKDAAHSEIVAACHTFDYKTLIVA